MPIKLNSKRKEHLSDLGVLFSAVLFGSTFFILKDIINDIHPVTLVAYRFALASTLMLIILLIKKIKVFQNWKQGLTLGLLMALMYIPQVIGLQYTTASNSAFITGLFVLFVVVFGVFFFKHKLNTKKVISIILAVGGLWFLTGGISNINLGDTITLLTAVAIAFHVLVANKYIKTNQSNPLALNFQQILVTTIVAFIMMLFFNFSFSYNNFETTIAIIYLAIFATVLTYGIQLVAQKYTTPTKVGLFFGTEPVFAALFAWTVGGEEMVPIKALGGLLIVAAIIVAELPNFKKCN